MTGGPGPAWLGIDLGTQSVRALVVDDGGRVLATAAAPLSGRRDVGRHEQDPDHWWDAVCTAVRTALGSTHARIAGVAVDGTSGTVLLADATGAPLTAGIMYDDGRASSEVVEVNDAGAVLWSALGYQRMQATWALPKLVWLRDNRPDLLRAPGTRVMHQTDFITSRLAGRLVATDLSSALKTGADLVGESWPAPILDALSIPPAVLPPLVRSGTLIATVGEDAARLTGLPAGTPVAAGCTDGCAAQLGAGALGTGDWNSVLGTTLVLKGVSKTLIEDPSGVLYSHRGPEGQWLPGGASSSGAGVISRDFAPVELPELERAARALRPAPATTYPLVSQGERFPFHAPQAHGFTLGTPADAGERYAAVLQGLAFVERLCLDYLAFLGADVSGRLLLTGGATKSAYWSQLRADVAGRSVYLPATAEPALGAAILAATAVTGEPAPAIASRMVTIATVLHPDDDDRFAAPYVSFVQALEGRGWLAADVASYARSAL